MSQIFWRWVVGRLSAVLANSYVVTHGGSKYVLGTVPRCEIGLHMHAHLQVSSDTCKVDEEKGNAP